MARLFATYFYTLLVALIATALIAYPQALVMKAPDRGLVATAITLTAFFGAYLSVLFIGVVFLARLAVWAISASCGHAVWMVRARSRVAFLCGTSAALLILALTPLATVPLEGLGFGAVWILAAGTGTMAAEAGSSAFSRISWKIFAAGTAATAALGFLAVAAEFYWAA